MVLTTTLYHITHCNTDSTTDVAAACQEKMQASNLHTLDLHTPTSCHALWITSNTNPSRGTSDTTHCFAQLFAPC